MEERLGAAFVLWRLPILVKSEHGNAKDGKQEAEPYEVCLGRVSAVLVVLESKLS